MKKFLYPLICLLAFFSCSEGTPGEEGSGSSGSSGGGGGSQPQITLDVTSSDFTVDGGSKLVTFTASEAWTASVVNGRASGWCKVEPTSGSAGNASVTITTTVNDTPDDRTASVVIKAGSVSKTVSVSQKQKDALTLTSSKFELSSQGGEVQIEVKANINYEYEIDEQSKSWITASGTRALKTSTVTLKVSENDKMESRSGKVYIKGNGFNETVDIYQAGETPAIVISQKEYTVSSTGGTITVDVSSNVDVEVELPSGVDWISENATRSTSTHTYRFDVAPSEEYNQRTAEIKFINKENNLAETVTVTQVQKDALVLAKDNYTVSNGGGQIEVEVSHNIDFDVSIGVDWISQVTSRSLNTSTLVFNVSANTAYDSRLGVITFTSKDGTISQTVSIYQAAGDALIISQKDMVVGQESGSLSFEIQSNLEFTVSDPDVDWLRPITNRGLTTHTLRYEYDANTSYESRVAKIIVTDIQNNQCDTLTVTQAQKDALVLAKESYTVENTGGQLSVEIGHNVDFDVSIDVDWITQPASRSFVTSALVFNVEPNTNYDSRSGVITFTSKDGSITQKVTVAQFAEQALIVSNKDITLGSSSGTFSFEVQTNVEFSVSTPDVDWLRPVADASSRGLITHTLRYEYDANTTYESRQAQIVVTDTQNNRSETIAITQVQKDVIVLSENIYKIDYKGGQIQIKVDYNVEFDIVIDVDWITQSTSRSLVNSILVFNVAENPNAKYREGIIKFSSKNGLITQIVKVLQVKDSSFDPSINDWEDDGEHGGTAE